MGHSESKQVVERNVERKVCPPENLMVQVDQAIAKRGIPISGRYSYIKKLENEYTIEKKVLGSGINGPVHLAISKRDGKMYAVKSFKKSGLTPRLQEELRNEVELYLSLDHPHVARLEMVFEADDAIHLVMEHMAGGELYDRLAARKQYTEEAAAETLYQMLLAVAYLHAHQIAHRDLKLENFLYESKDTDHLKLIDFGFAKYWDPSTKMSQSCGSIHYVAPEVLGKAYTTQADMWSMGILAYMLLTGTPPFRGLDQEVLQKIKSGTPHYSARFHSLSGPARGFVESLLVRNPNERLSAADALGHPFIVGRQQAGEAQIDVSILTSLRSFARASHFRRASLSMMAWSLSPEDRKELRKQFLLLDTENRGTVKHTELKNILVNKMNICNIEAEELFNCLDTDNDQELEYSEFLAAAIAGRVKFHEDVLRRTFSRFDQDHTGLICAKDLKSVLGCSFEAADIEDMIREVDTSGDGNIDYSEFLAYFQKPEPEAELDAASAEPRHSAKRALQRKRTEQLGDVLDQLMDTELVLGGSSSTLPTLLQSPAQVEGSLQEKAKA